MRLSSVMTPGTIEIGRRGPTNTTARRSTGADSLLSRARGDCRTKPEKGAIWDTQERYRRTLLMDRSNQPVSKDEFLAEAWPAANDKARELGWIV
jgi:hypothetical protein